MNLSETLGKTLAVACANSLTVHNFRNYALMSVDLSPGKNIVIGENGQGKSNLLEALYLISSTKSFRNAKDAEMVRFDADAYGVEATVGEFDETLALSYTRGSRRQAFAAESKLPKVHDLLGRLPSVCFSAADLTIASGEPSARRAFLDTEISACYPAYRTAHGIYKRALEHRNSVLRSVREGTEHASSLDPWTAKMASAGAVIRQGRAQFVGDIRTIAERCHRELCRQAEVLTLDYAPSDSADTPDALTQVLDEKKDIDIRAGTTTGGPHRDELNITIDGAAARAFGSQGQQRSAVLSLKVSVAMFWQQSMGCMPLLLLDDILSDLDEGRRSMILHLAGGLGQVVITAADLALLSPEVLSGAKVFRVKEGAVQAE